MTATGKLAGILRGMPCECAHRYKCNHCGEWQPANYPFCGRCELLCSLQTPNKCLRCQALAIAEKQERHDAPYRAACCEAYQILGGLIPDIDARVLDNLSALANGEKAPHDWGAIPLTTFAAHDERARREIAKETLLEVLTHAERTGPRNHDEMVVPAESIQAIVAALDDVDWSATGGGNG